jgi:hypothetical protein
MGAALLVLLAILLQYAARKAKWQGQPTCAVVRRGARLLAAVATAHKRF